MSTPDLHPEELIDKAAAGTLSTEERAWLDGHLAQCSVCRFELQARRDFENAPTAGLSVDNIVARALAGVPTRDVAPPPRRRRNLTGFIAVAAALSAMASFAAVTNAGSISHFIATVLGTATPPPAPAPAVPQHVAPHVEREVVPETPPPPPPEPVVEPEPTPVVRAAPRVETARLPPPPVAPVVQEPTASELFTRANGARAAGLHAEAADEYRTLIGRYPSSNEATISHALLGRLLLDEGDAGAAVTEFEAYQRSGDATLREEVLAARATAAYRIADAAQEMAAWSALLEAFPESVHAERARLRLEALRTQ